MGASSDYTALQITIMGIRLRYLVRGLVWAFFTFWASVVLLWAATDNYMYVILLGPIFTAGAFFYVVLFGGAQEKIAKVKRLFLADHPELAEELHEYGSVDENGRIDLPVTRKEPR